MEDVIQIQDQFYILATSSLADDRTRVLKSGETFAVLNRLGDVEAAGDDGNRVSTIAGRAISRGLRCAWGTRFRSCCGQPFSVTMRFSRLT